MLSPYYPFASIEEINYKLGQWRFDGYEKIFMGFKFKGVDKKN